TAMAIAEVSRVPATSGQIPTCLSANSGVQRVSPKNSARDTRPKNEKVSKARTSRMPAVTSTDSAPQASRPISISRSRSGVAARPRPWRARSLMSARGVTALVLQELLDRHADLRAAKGRPGAAIGHPLAGQLVGRRRQRDVADLLRQLGPPGQVVVGERPD